MNALENIFNVSEIFYSIQGEGSRAGLPCTFIRMQGCRLRCSWCDTPYALELKQKEVEMSGQDILNKIEEIGCNFVEFTGGEPLEQELVKDLMRELCDRDYTVAVETSGYIDISDLDKRITKILDIKCPDSNMSKKNKYENIDSLTKNDEVKFVLASEKDYNWACEIVKKYQLPDRVNSVLFSPVFGKLDYKYLAERILADKLNVRMQLQLHKFIWEPDKRGV